MFNLKNDPIAVTTLTQKNNFENTINNPNSTRLNLSGTRWGAIYYTGGSADRLIQKTSEGGL